MTEDQPVHPCTCGTLITPTSWHDCDVSATQPEAPAEPQQPATAQNGGPCCIGNVSPKGEYVAIETEHGEVLYSRRDAVHAAEQLLAAAHTVTGASQQPATAAHERALAALRAIYERMCHDRAAGDEWAMEWLGECWPGLVPADLRARVGDEDAETDAEDGQPATEHSDAQGHREQLRERIAQAIGDPGSILPRKDGQSVPQWSADAVLAVVGERDHRYELELTKLRFDRDVFRDIAERNKDNHARAAKEVTRLRAMLGDDCE